MMELNLTTTQVDPKIVVEAYQLYKAGKFREAIPVLQDLLDIEAMNWQARLFLAVCWFKTGQPAAAIRSLRHTYENCPDRELKQKACFALQFVNQEVNKKTHHIPLEFGNTLDVSPSHFEDLQVIVG